MGKIKDMEKSINPHLKQLSGKLVALSKIIREANEELTYYTIDLNNSEKTPPPCNGTDFLQFLMHYEDKVVRGALSTREFLDLYDIK